MGIAGLPRLLLQQGARQSLASGLGGLRRWQSVFPQSAPWNLEQNFSCARKLPALPGFWEALTRGKVKYRAENYGQR